MAGGQDGARRKSGFLTFPIWLPHVTGADTYEIRLCPYTRYSCECCSRLPTVSEDESAPHSYIHQFLPLQRAGKKSSPLQVIGRDETTTTSDTSTATLLYIRLPRQNSALNGFVRCGRKITWGPGLRACKGPLMRGRHGPTAARHPAR